MTLTELRKRYLGKNVSERYDKQRSIPIKLDADPEHQYFAEVTIDDNRKITHISKMTGHRLVNDDATRASYESIRINANDYDLIEDEIEALLDPEETKKEAGPTVNISQTDEEKLRQAVKHLDTMEETARHVSFHISTEYYRKCIRDLMQKIADNEHRYFQVVEEYNPELHRNVLVLKERTPEDANLPDSMKETINP